MGADAGPGGMRGAGCGLDGGRPSSGARVQGGGLRRDDTDGVDGAPQGAGERSGPDCGASSGSDERLPRAGLSRKAARGDQARPGKINRKASLLTARPGKINRKASLLTARKSGPIHIMIRHDPDRLDSRYSQDEIRKMIAEGKVVEVIGRWRRVTRP